jgi:drug/metabolite transporter (DMT)-like permease
LSSPKRGYFVGGIFICLLGAVCFSTKAIFVKMAYRDATVDVATLLALRMIFSLPFFAISAFTFSNQKENVRFNRKQWLGVALIGCLGYYISSLLDFSGLQYVSAGIERLILFVYPTLVLILSALLFKEKITVRQWTAVIITYAGLALAFVSEINFQTTPSDHFYLGSVLILACAFTYAGYIVGSGKLIPLVGAAKFNSYAMSFASVAVLIHFFVVSDQSLLHLEPTVYLYSFLMAILSTVIPSYLVAEGIKRIGSNNAAIAGSIGPVSTILQAYIFLGESVSMIQIFGTILILVGVLLISMKRSNSVVINN